MVVFTIGYEGHTPGGFVQELLAAGVEVLVDVRELPLSRKKGFSKGPLSQALEANGIGYAHWRDLGTPRPLREGLRKTGDYAAFFKGYREHLERNRPVVEALVRFAKDKPVCLMCFEKDYQLCHRSVLAAELSSAGFEVRHL